MKKTIVILFLALLQLGCFAQSTYFTRKGHIYFISHTNVIDIDANNYQAAGFLDIESGKIQFAVLIKSFKFTLATAKEHFNESYMESDKYPKATFKGQILNIDSLDFNKNGIWPIYVKGDIMIRGITKNIEVPGVLSVEKGQINAKSEFELLISDFNISVPRIVENRVSEIVKVKVNMNYSLYQK